MSTQNIPFQPINGAPMTITLGTDDKSIKRRLYERPPRAIHLPLCFMWAEWGPHDDAKLMYGNTIPLTFGDETTNLRGKFANHATPYVQLFLSNANPILLKRLVPRDIGPKASVRIYADMVEDEFDEYDREIDGSFKRDNAGELVTTGNKVNGVKLRFVSEVIPTDPVTKISEFGKGTIKTGSLSSSTGVVSKMYPILDIEAPHLGSKGNNHGIRIWAPTDKDSNPVKRNLIEKDKVYPFRTSLVSRLNENTSSRLVDTIYGEKYDDFCLKPDLVDTDYNKDRFIKNVVIDGFQDMNPGPGAPVRYGPFGDLVTYQDNLKVIMEKILVNEKDQAYFGNELTALTVGNDSEDYFLVNLFGLQQASGIPYQTARFEHGGNGIRFTENTDIYLTGASDGTMTDEEFADLVEAEIDQFADPNSKYQDIIEYPCSFFWDSGFPLRTKYKMGKFISQRKNTVVIISNYVSGERPLTTSEESARHVAIVERVRSFAESDYFATPTMRATVVSRSGQPLQSSYRKRLPCSYELANMVSRMAAGRSFKSVYLFDRVPYNKFELLGNVNSVWAPSSVRNRDWTMGMMWPEKLSQNEIYFPAARTVYKDDTSILTSLITAMVIAECQTVGILCQKQFSGGHFTKAQLKTRVEDYCRDELAMRFGELYRIRPECYFTDADDNRGYSWTLKIEVWGPMMRTVETLYVEAHDLDDIPADSPAFVS